MKKVCVVGHFGFGENMLNGQTIKTKTVTTELEKQLGADQVMKIDTHGGAKALPKITVQLINAFKNCKNIIIFPAHNGIKVFVPLCNALNIVFHRKLHYVVIGGWLNKLLDEQHLIEQKLRKFYGIYVETNTMKRALDQRGFNNVYVMPNFKDVKVLSSQELIFSEEPPFKICTFSRVMKEKGIEDAIEAVKRINENVGSIVYTLDIFGQIDSEQVEWFENLKNNFPSYVSYKGLVPFDATVDIVKDYYFLLFPTRFYTEGIPGTILDAYAAGVPVISSIWENFSDIIDNGKTGMGYEFGSIEDLERVLNYALDSTEHLLSMKKNCIDKALEFSPERAINILKL